MLSMFTAITLTQFMLKNLIAANIFKSPSAYAADGFYIYAEEVGKHESN